MIGSSLLSGRRTCASLQKLRGKSFQESRRQARAGPSRARHDCTSNSEQGAKLGPSCHFRRSQNKNWHPSVLPSWLKCSRSKKILKSFLTFTSGTRGWLPGPARRRRARVEQPHGLDLRPARYRRDPGAWNDHARAQHCRTRRPGCSVGPFVRRPCSLVWTAQGANDVPRSRWQPRRLEVPRRPRPRAVMVHRVLTVAWAPSSGVRSVMRRSRPLCVCEKLHAFLCPLHLCCSLATS